MYDYHQNYFENNKSQPYCQKVILSSIEKEIVVTNKNEAIIQVVKQPHFWFFIWTPIEDLSQIFNSKGFIYQRIRLKYHQFPKRIQSMLVLFNTIFYIKKVQYIRQSLYIAPY